MNHTRKRVVPKDDLRAKPLVINKDCSYTKKAIDVLNNIPNSTVVQNIS